MPALGGSVDEPEDVADCSDFISVTVAGPFFLAYSRNTRPEMLGSDSKNFPVRDCWKTCGSQGY